MSKYSNIMLVRAILAVLCLVVVSSCSRESRKANVLAKADQYFKTGEYEKAEIEYKNAIQLDRSDSHAYGRLGTIYLEQGRLVQSAGFLKTAVDLRADNLDARVKLGYVHLALGKRVEAREAALFALTKNPAHSEAPLLLAESIAEPKDAVDARATLEKLPASQSSAPILTALGLINLREGKLSEAESVLDQARRADPKYTAAHSTFAALYSAQKDPVRAEKALATALETAPLRSPARIQLAHFQFQSGRVDVAKQMLDEAIVKTPDFLPSYLLRANIAYNQKLYSESVALLERLLARDDLNPGGLMLMAQVQTAMGELDKARTTLEKAVASYPSSPQFNQLLGNAYAAQGDLEKGSARLAQAVKLAPKFSEAILGLAKVEIRQRNFVSAIASLQEFLKDNPGNGQAELLLAEAYRGQGNTNGALSIYRALAASNPKNGQLQLMIGSTLLQENKKDEARTALTSALSLSPSLIPALEQLVNLDLLDKQFSASVSRVEAHAATDPKNAAFPLLLAKIYIAQSDRTKAEEALQKAISLQPELALPYQMLSQLYLTTGESEKALSSLKAIVARSPKDVQSQFLIGVLSEQKKEYTAARASYEKVLELNPKSIAALNNLAYLLSERFGEIDKALELAQQARTLAPTQAECLDTLGWILYKKQQYARAVGLLEESAGKLPDNAEAQFHAGMAHYMMGRENRARETLERVVSLQKDSATASEAQHHLSVIALDPKKVNDAMRKTLQEILGRRPDDPIALSRLAAIHEQDGSIEKATAVYESILKTNPGNLDAAVNAVRLYRTRNETAKALELAKVTRKLAPTDGRIAHALGRLAFDSGDFRWSAGVLQEATRQLAPDAELQFDFGEASYSIGQIATAESAFREAISINPQFSRAAKAQEYLDLIAVYRNPPAVEGSHVALLLKTDPSNAAALFAQGMVDERNKNFAAAQDNYKKGLARFPDFAPAKRQLTLVNSVSKSDDKEALTIASGAREAFPSDPEVAKAFGVILYRNGNYARAIALLQESARSLTTDAEVLYYLGMSQRKNNDSAGGSRSLEQALELGLSPRLAADARQVLAAKK